MNQPPPEVIAAALLIGNWMREHNIERWEMGDICSRNHAHDLRSMETAVKEFVQTTSTIWPANFAEVT